jgi:hypothetical protein
MRMKYYMMSFDDFSKYCPKFANGDENINNGYTCGLKGNEDGCYIWNCPYCYEAGIEDFKDKNDYIDIDHCIVNEKIIQYFKIPNEKISIV